MLKAHQACIDLGKGVLRIQNREVRFLSEHELPDKARIMDAGADDPAAPPTAGPSSTSNTAAAPSNPAPATSFPGGGHAVGASAAGTPRAAVAAQRRAPAAIPAQRTSQYPESDIATLMGLGASREMAISTLDAAGGNLDIAASLLF